MDIAEAVRKGKEARRAAWPEDWCVEPTNNELACVFFSQEKSAPRWEPTREDLVANDWELISTEISQEKLDWLKLIGAKKFKHPMTWDDGHDLYSDEYLAETPLEVLKARHIE